MNALAMHGSGSGLTSAAIFLVAVAVAPVVVFGRLSAPVALYFYGVVKGRGRSRRRDEAPPGNSF